MHVTPRRTWQEELQEAVHETDPHLWDGKLRNAEIALFHRIHSFSPGPDFQEAQEMYDALNTIRHLRGTRRVSHSLVLDPAERSQDPSPT